MTFPSRFLTLGLASLSLSVFASAITTRHDVADSQYVANAGLFPNASIGEVNGSFASGSGTYLGFGNGSHWMLTAGHVTSGNTIQNVRFGGQVINATGQITHPNFNFNTLAFDLGLVRIASAPTGITPIRFTTLSNLIGERVVFGGYGLHGIGSNTNRSYDGLNRGAENIIDFSQGSGGSKFWFTTFTNPTQGNALPLEGTTASGDSGGGMFWHDGADWRLTGVTSWGTDNFSRYGDQAAFVALHNHTDWLTDRTGITAVPEPTSMLLLGGVAALVLRRRRSN
ncbi:MAG: trypsin-like serine protease [Fimbriimonadaceae bacterium]|nr:trypsin-like serine protease [Fimbriimonadaceae bacterium]